MDKNYCFSWCLVCWGKEFTEYGCDLGNVRVYGNKKIGYHYKINKTEMEFMWDYLPLIKADFVPVEDSRHEVLQYLIANSTK